MVYLECLHCESGNLTFSQPTWNVGDEFSISTIASCDDCAKESLFELEISDVIEEKKL